MKRAKKEKETETVKKNRNKIIATGSANEHTIINGNKINELSWNEQIKYLSTASIKSRLQCIHFDVCLCLEYGSNRTYAGLFRTCILLLLSDWRVSVLEVEG